MRLEPLPDLTWLELQWRELEARSNASVFLGWSWIGAWLRLIGTQYPLSLLSVHYRQRLVGLGLITARRRFLGLGPLHLRLHEVGDRDIDNLTIEYNGLLTESGLERPCLTAMITHLAQHHRRWSTLFLPGIPASLLDTTAPAITALEHRITAQTTRHIDLAALRASGTGYLDQLSPNTRSAIRRTQRKIVHTHGALHLDLASNAEERHHYFQQMTALHQAHWRSRHHSTGAFANERICQFHRELMSDREQPVQLLRLSAGEHAIGYLYTFVYRNTVYFYQSGIDYPRFATCGSPGLLLLSHAIEHALAQGHTCFDFLAGDSRYKRALANAQNELLWVSLDRSGPVARARRLWHRLSPPQ